MRIWQDDHSREFSSIQDTKTQLPVMVRDYVETWVEGEGIQDHAHSVLAPPFMPSL